MLFYLHKEQVAILCHHNVLGQMKKTAIYSLLILDRKCFN